jgi:YidC/Oxa1 family membrane protein insertase
VEKRALIAIVLSVALLLAWQEIYQRFLAPPPPPPGTPAAGSASMTPEPSGGAGLTGAAGVPAGGAAAAVDPARPVLAGGARAGGPVVEVTTPLYEVTFAPDGPVTSWILRYRGKKPLLVGPGLAPLALAVAAPGRPSEVVPLRADTDRLELTAERPKGTVVFSGLTASGSRLEKRIHFDAASYRVEVELHAAGGGGGAEAGSLALYWTGPVAIPGKTREAPWLTFGEGAEHSQLLGRILVARDGKPEVLEHPTPALRDPKESPARAELKDPRLEPVRVEPGVHRWVALENDYFIAAFVPGPGALVLRGRDRDLAQVGVVFPEVPMGPGRTWEGRAELYVGPKEWDRLAALNIGLEQAQARNYGEFLWTLPMEWFCVPLLWLMNFFATRLPGQNYGVAIILLTVLVKIAFYPLSHKSMTSMKQMQALQPQLNALRSKYKSDPQRFQREQMELFRKHKVNPMGGCLPMVVQIPIFYALYLTLQYSVELQGAPFLLWITDLSKKDPYYVLPILMGISMLVQQKMTPTVGDPRQAKVMLIMPVIFTFMFLEFPTGLVLYWLVNNVLSVAQQYLIDRSVQRRSRPGGGVEGKPEKEAKKV